LSYSIANINNCKNLELNIYNIVKFLFEIKKIIKIKKQKSLQKVTKIQTKKLNKNIFIIKYYIVSFIRNRIKVYIYSSTYTS